MNEETKEFLLALANRLENKARYESGYGNSDVDEARNDAIRMTYQGIVEEIRWLVSPDPEVPRCEECGSYGIRGSMTGEIMHVWQCSEHPSFKNRKF